MSQPQGVREKKLGNSDANLSFPMIERHPDPVTRDIAFEVGVASQRAEVGGPGGYESADLSKSSASVTGKLARRPSMIPA